MNLDSFKSNFIEHFKSIISANDLRNEFEKVDSLNNGLLDKVEFCKVIQKFTQEYRDEDIMRFLRISSLYEGHKKVKYPEFVELIFYDSKINYLNKIMTILDEKFRSGNRNLKSLVKLITSKNNINYIEISEIFAFLKRFIPDLKREHCCKLDIDQDGKINMDDLRAVLERFNGTSFFKYENTDQDLEININSNQGLSQEKYREIVKDIKTAMKNKNLTDIGLFMKLDTNNDGFVSNIEFNKNIDSIIKIAPSIKDQFFNTLDVRKLGLVDLDTFLEVFKIYSNDKVFFI